MTEVNQFSEKLLLHYAAPNRSLVVDAMQYDAELFDSLSDSELSKYILVLGQYLVHLQYETNLKRVEYLLLSKTLDHKINVNKILSVIPNNLTNDKQRRSWLVEHSEEIRGLDYECTKMEALCTISDDMSKKVESLLNAFKKEKSTRLPQER